MDYSIFKKIKRFDAYSKPSSDFTIRTVSGGIVSILASVLMILLTILEFRYYLAVDVHQELIVDIGRNDKVNISFNITLLKLPCSLLSVDAMDVSGHQQSDIYHDVYKTPLDTSGIIVSRHMVKEQVANYSSDGGSSTTTTTAATTITSADCGSCYGAESKRFSCCNTCAQLKSAYTARGWALSSLDNIEICKGETANIRDDIEKGFGCNLFGVIKVNKVAGNIHIAPGRQNKELHSHVHDMTGLMNLPMNVSHRIEYLGFGAEFPEKIDPLSSTDVIAKEHWTSFKYYVKIVPAVYEYLNGTQVYSYQYSVTQHTKSQDQPMLEKSLPGVFFIYEITPLMVKYWEESRSFVHFVTSLCAIVGGVFTVSAIVDSLLYNAIKMYNKQRIGKLG